MKPECVTSTSGEKSAPVPRGTFGHFTHLFLILGQVNGVGSLGEECLLDRRMLSW